MGVALPPAGSCAFHISLPVVTSNARKNGSYVPPMKTSPPAVTIGPPRLIAPGGTWALPGANEPSGTCQRIFPSPRSMAESIPHGGALHGNFDGDRNGERYIANGAPACRVYSPMSSSGARCARSSANLSCGLTRTLNGKLLVF